MFLRSVAVCLVLLLVPLGACHSVVLCHCIAKLWRINFFGVLVGIGYSAFRSTLTCGLYLVSSYGMVSDWYYHIYVFGALVSSHGSLPHHPCIIGSKA